MKLLDIQVELNNKKYIIRSEFMRDYNFDGKYFKYLSEFICDNIQSKNSMFLTDLIYFASKINLNTAKFQNILKKILFTDSRYLVKLAVLDYFVELENKFLPASYEKLLLQLAEKRNYKIVKNQIYFNLFILNSSSIEIYYNNLKDSLESTEDWRSIYRTLLNYKYVESRNFIVYKKSIINQIKKLNEVKKFGEGVEEILLQIDS